MNVYIIEPNIKDIKGKCLIAANNSNEAIRIFDYNYKYAVDDCEYPSKQWKCNIYEAEDIITTVITSQILIDAIV